MNGITGNCYQTLSTPSIKSAGADLTGRGPAVLQWSADGVASSVKALEALALSPSIIAAVESQNAAYAARTPAEMEAEIQRLDAAWQAEDPAVESLEASIAENATSSHQLALYATRSCALADAGRQRSARSEPHWS